MLFYPFILEILKQNQKIDSYIIKIITFHFGLHQIINDPTHSLGKSSSCTDLVVYPGVHSSRYADCHHQVALAKFDSRIYYRQPCERELWQYQEAGDILIRREIHEFNWERALSNLNVDEQVTAFIRTILNTMKNLFPMKLLYAMTRIRR